MHEFLLSQALISCHLIHLICLNYLCMFYTRLVVVVRKQIPQKCRTNTVSSLTSQSKDKGSTTPKSDNCQPPADQSTNSGAMGIYVKLHNLQFPASGLTRKFKHESLDLSNRLFSKKPFVDPATKTRNVVTLDHTECLKKSVVNSRATWWILHLL